MAFLRSLQRKFLSIIHPVIPRCQTSRHTAQLNGDRPVASHMPSLCRSYSLGNGIFFYDSVSVERNGLEVKKVIARVHSLCVCSARTYELEFVRMAHGSARTYQLEFVRMAHGSVKTEICDESDAGNQKLTEHTLKDAEKICSILADHPPSSVNTVLDQLGLKIFPELVIEILMRLSNAGVLALAFFHWAAKQEGFRHSTEIYHQLIEALGKIKQFRLVWDLVNAMMAGGFLTKDTFMLISRRYARAKKLKDAAETFDKMEKYGFSPDISDFNRLIDNISKSKNVKMAQQVVYDAKRRRKFFPDLKTYSILLEGWGQQLDINKVIQIYQEMMGEGFKPDQVAYGILVNAFCKCRKIEEAVKIFQEMEARNIQPSPHSYCSVINALGANKRLDDALKYFKKANACGIPCDLPLYNAVVGAYCWSGQYENAYNMLDEMKRCGIGLEARTFDVILNHLIRAKRTEEAYCLFQKMETHHNCMPKINTYTMIMRMLCVDSQVDLALEVWKQMKERGMLPCMHMFLVIINRLCYDNQLEEARQFFEEMLDRGLRPPDQLYSNLAQSLQNGGKGEWAIMLKKRLYEVRNAALSG